MKSSIIIKVAVIFFLFFLHIASAQRLVTPFSGKLPSEIYLASLSPENSPSIISATERELLFFGPPGGGTGGDTMVGGAPVRDCLWALVFCCLVYGIYHRNKLSSNNKQI
jgi:hypothetical protein